MAAFNIGTKFTKPFNSPMGEGKVERLIGTCVVTKIDGEWVEFDVLSIEVVEAHGPVSEIQSGAFQAKSWTTQNIKVLA